MSETIRLQYFFDDGSGNKINDFSYYNTDATLVQNGSGTGTWDTDTPFTSGTKTDTISSYSYDLSGNYFVHNLVQDWSGSFTLALWTKPTAAQDLFSSVFSTSDNHTIDNSWQLDANSNGKWRINHSEGQFSFSSDISVNTWQHLAISWNNDLDYDKRYLKLYYNGQLKKTFNYESATILPTSMDFIFEKYKLGINRNDDKSYIGKITNLLIYDIALSDEDITNIYNYNIDPSGSIHTDCSDCEVVTPETNHIFLPVYLDSNKKVISQDNSENAVSSLDASYNFIMNATYTKAEHIRKMLKYKKLNNKYLFSFNESYKILLENGIQNDISGTAITIYDSSFNSGIDPGEASIGRMLVRYIADSLMGHPFAQAFIANEKEIIDAVNSSNLHLQITTSLLNNLTTTDYSDNEICLSVIEQFIENAPSRFLNEVEGEIYNFPFCKGDYITLFIKMSCDINLSQITGKGFNTNIYQILKKMFGDKDEIEFDDSLETMNIVEKNWRVKILLN